MPEEPRVDASIDETERLEVKPLEQSVGFEPDGDGRTPIEPQQRS